MDPQTSSTFLEGPVSLVKKAFAIYKSRISLFLQLGVIVFLAGILYLVPAFNRSMPLFALAIIVYALVSYFLNLGYIKAVAHTEKNTVALVFQGLTALFLPALFVSILGGLAVGGGLVLLVIPGLILSLQLTFAIYAFVLDGHRGMNALTQSWFLTRGHWWAIFGRIILALIAVLVVGIVVHIITRILGLENMGPLVYTLNDEDPVYLGKVLVDGAINAFFTIPFMVAFMYSLYQSLKQKVTTSLSEADMAKARKYIKTFIVIGIVAAGLLLIFSGYIISNFSDNLPEMQNYAQFNY